MAVTEGDRALAHAWTLPTHVVGQAAEMYEPSLGPIAGSSLVRFFVRSEVQINRIGAKTMDLEVKSFFYISRFIPNKYLFFFMLQFAFLMAV